MKKVYYVLVCAVVIFAVSSAYAAEGIKVDIPVVFKDAKVVFNMDHLAFDGDKPVGIKYMLLMRERMKETKTTRIIGIFHGDAAYMTLTDEAYNKFRKINTGNPYKKLIADMVAMGIELEECMVSMMAHGWVNSDLLPGIKVNGGAVSRLIQLGQEGYVTIHP
ncbi:DsrE family protein [Candidatus Magnetominusculus xianensis]|uniref:Sulfur reduction protein DsrE n=1 Tax=Candidatus Magnetominusculus xianensis TaxID=1748249 RepID=A0ABR5SJQ5_9BACT|nr:DsrE family protein [Candidatus Magnetominusculus xianensis]KWT86798.1 sulfur reduction protein DsrE [Candidatus Magnetominusculus xianensis]MBF0402484.1 DsrE family protein [Nitrospirota bacterium]